MPGVAAHAGSWILERFVLEPGDRQFDGAAVFDEALAVGGDEVRHRAPFPNMAVQPQPAVHRVHHPFASQCELAVRPVGERAVLVDRCAAHSGATILDQLQVIRPSRVAGEIAVAVPKYTVHVSAPSDWCVAAADQPPGVASGMVIVTPGDALKLS